MASANPSQVAKKTSRIDRLVQRHLETDSEAESDDEAASQTDPSTRWKVEFQRYLDTHDLVPNGMNIVHWWGVCLV